jgi:hypothetical protein
MRRVWRVDVRRMVYHALNRSNFRSRLFKEEAHYEDFLGRNGARHRFAHRFPQTR